MKKLNILGILGNQWFTDLKKKIVVGDKRWIILNPFTIYKEKEKKY